MYLCSYRSVHSAGGTRKVVRRRKRGDGTYSAEQEYDSEADEEGKARRRQRRRQRKHGADSAHSYYRYKISCRTHPPVASLKVEFEADCYIVFNNYSVINTKCCNNTYIC